jgi:hypothetical protein
MKPGYAHQDQDLALPRRGDAGGRDVRPLPMRAASCLLAAACGSTIVATLMLVLPGSPRPRRNVGCGRGGGGAGGGGLARLRRLPLSGKRAGAIRQQGRGRGLPTHRARSGERHRRRLARRCCRVSPQRGGTRPGPGSWPDGGGGGGAAEHLRCGHRGARGMAREPAAGPRPRRSDCRFGARQAAAREFLGDGGACPASRAPESNADGGPAVQRVLRELPYAQRRRLARRPLSLAVPQLGGGPAQSCEPAGGDAAWRAARDGWRQRVYAGF